MKSSNLTLSAALRHIADGLYQVGDINRSIEAAAVVEASERLHDIDGCLRDAVEDAGFTISGPTDHRAAENGEPKWVCRARELLAIRR